MIRRPPRMTRRTFLVGTGSAFGLALLPQWACTPTGRGPGVIRLRTGPGDLSLEPVGPEIAGSWGYNGSVPGPVLRYRQGQRLRVVLDNGLEEGTTIHWHGIRLPNAMDGVPHVTQAPVGPGETFDYAFDLPDAGTYWYHSHLNGSEQLGRGLAGALIVEEPEPYAADRDVVWFLDDWLLTAEGVIVADFNTPRDITHAGRIGNTVTINGKLPHDLNVRPGERIRLRLINGANGRAFALSFGDLPIHVVALDGQPVVPHEPAAGRVVVGPGMRADLVVDCVGEPGTRVAIADDFYRGRGFELMGLAIEGDAVRGAPPSTPPPALPANPVPEPDLDGAERHEIVFGGGMMGGMAREQMMAMIRQGMAWTVNGEPVPSPGHHDHAPLFTVERGRTCRVVYRNETRWHHPIHVHGHHFRVLRRNGTDVPHQPLRDTVLMNPLETVETAFVADNPGDWMLHCHVLEHQASGMTGMFRVRG